MAKTNSNSNPISAKIWSEVNQTLEIINSKINLYFMKFEPDGIGQITVM